MFFDKKPEKPLKSEEFETILKRVIDLEQRIRRLELNEIDLRDKVLRKIQLKSAMTEQEATPQILPPSRTKKKFGGKSKGVI